MSRHPVLVIGAGPTGLVLALSLARRGIPVRIVDRAGGPGLASRAMVVQARTLEFYRQLGFAEAVVAAGVPMAAIHLREDGEEVARVSFAAMGAGISPYPFALCYPQDDHERFLVDRLAEAGVAVEWGVELRSFAQDAVGVRAVLGGPDGAEEQCEAAWLCGCDGAHSRVRQGLGLDFPGGTYEQLFFVADAEVEGGFRRDFFLHLGAHAFVLMLPVRSRGVQRLIGIVPEALGGREGIGFEDLRAPVEALLGVRVARVNWFSTYRVHHRVAARFRVGRVFIAGDAGHIHSPAGGQGMNTGIGDAVNLGWKLAEVVRGRAAEAILETYGSERIGFARSLVETTDRAFRGMVSPGRAGQFLRRWLLPHVVPLLAGLGVARRAMFATVSQVRIHYPDSALSEGAAGGIEAGDRLPWLAGADNFAGFASLGWRLQLHGEAPELAGAAAALGLAVDARPWSAAAGEAGFAEGAGYLVRPDLHVGWAGRDAAGLRGYVSRWGVGG